MQETFAKEGTSHVYYYRILCVPQIPPARSHSWKPWQGREKKVSYPLNIQAQVFCLIQAKKFPLFKPLFHVPLWCNLTRTWEFLLVHLSFTQPFCCRQIPALCVSPISVLFFCKYLQPLLSQQPNKPLTSLHLFLLCLTSRITSIQ